jgi:hypothetical protein
MLITMDNEGRQMKKDDIEHFHSTQRILEEQAREQAREHRTQVLNQLSSLLLWGSLIAVAIVVVGWFAAQN